MPCAGANERTWIADCPSPDLHVRRQGGHAAGVGQVGNQPSRADVQDQRLARRARSQRRFELPRIRRRDRHCRRVGGDQPDRVSVHLQVDDARAALLPQRAGPRLHDPRLEHRMRAADRRVAGKGQFGARREDAQQVIGARRHRRQHEGRLRQVGPGGDALHVRRRQVRGVQHHRYRIAAKRDSRKHVHLP
jgi:hypothetical protein